MGASRKFLVKYRVYQVLRCTLHFYSSYYDRDILGGVFRGWLLGDEVALFHWYKAYHNRTTVGRLGDNYN